MLCAVHVGERLAFEGQGNELACLLLYICEAQSLFHNQGRTLSRKRVYGRVER